LRENATIESYYEPAKITNDFLTKASAQFTDSIKKPEKWITTHFLGDQKMTFSGTTDPCAHVYIMSIGNLGTQENLRISAEISGFLETELGIPKDRAYIVFEDVKKDVVGWNGTTFETIL